MASANDFFMKVGRSTATTLASPGYTTGDTSINVASTTNWPADTGVTFAIDEVDSNGLRVSGTYNVFRGKVAGGTQIDEVTYVGGDTNRNYSAGATTRVYILVSAYRDNRFTDGILVEHDQDGTHTDITADSIVVAGDVQAQSFTITGSGGNQGWETGLPTPNTVTYNGNRSYDLVFNSTDLTDTLSPGMRIRTSRTVAAPTQCTSLNGTTQYWVKTSPNKLTFTDDFVVSAWIKVSSYAQGAIVSRFNGTSGWELRLEATGQVYFVGFNAGGTNFSYVQSYQSVPLNKWVHVTAQLDMSSFTATTTTSYVMLDGKDVPCVVARGGTNPTALVQAGNLEIGSRNGGTLLFPGKIAQVAIYNAKVTQANIVATISQGLSGSETSLASAYSFNNSTADLNTSTPNDLVAGAGSPTATNADSPFALGNDLASAYTKGTTDFGVVMATSFSTNTTVTVQVPEGCTIPTSGGVSAVYYSTQDTPYGFPRQRGKWRLTSMAKTIVSNGGSVSVGTWLNIGYRQFYLPIGSWMLGFNAVPYYYRTGTSAEFKATLSTANNTESNTELTIASSVEGASGTMAARNNMNRETDITVNSATQYYLNVTAVNNALGDAGWLDSYSPGIIYAENAYV